MKVISFLGGVESYSAITEEWFGGLSRRMKCRNYGTGRTQ